MPKVLLSEHVKALKRPKVNLIRTILSGYLEAGGISVERIGKETGVTGAAVRKMMRRPTEDWRIKEIDHMCDLTGCPRETIYVALSQRR